HATHAAPRDAAPPGNWYHSARALQPPDKTTTSTQSTRKTHRTTMLRLPANADAWIIERQRSPMPPEGTHERPHAALDFAHRHADDPVACQRLRNGRRASHRAEGLHRAATQRCVEHAFAQRQHGPDAYRGGAQPRRVRREFHTLHPYPALLRWPR